MHILSIDGGASQTRGTVFTSDGEVLVFHTTGPTSLSRPEGSSIAILRQFIETLVGDANLELGQIDLLNLGLAGVTNDEAREALFKEMRALGVEERLLITSDVEAAFETVWGAEPGVLVSVGTGAIGWARDMDGRAHRASGRGPQLGGDPASGYWLGKSLMVRLIMMETDEGPDVDGLRSAVMEYYSAGDFESAARLAGEADDPIQSLAALGRIVCEAAQADNEIALAILQEGTQSLANDLVEMIEGAGLKRETLTLGMNGSIIVHNEIFRRLLGAAMMYDIPEIEWKATDLDPVFGAGLIGARLKGIELDLPALRASWESLRVRTLG